MSATGSRTDPSDVLKNAIAGNETANFEFVLNQGMAKLSLCCSTQQRAMMAKAMATGVVGVGQVITELNQVLAASKRVADDVTRLIDTANAPIFGNRHSW